MIRVGDERTPPERSARHSGVHRRPGDVGSRNFFPLGRHVAHVRRLTAQEWPRYRDLRLRALADAPDAFGSTLARERDRTDSDWQLRLSAGASSAAELPLVLVDGAEFVGLAWGRIDGATPDVAHVFQMWVAPEGRGQGGGRSLLDTLISWARETGAAFVELDVTCGDTAARRLYERAGFRPVGVPRPLRPGSALMARRMRRVL